VARTAGILTQSHRLKAPKGHELPCKGPILFMRNPFSTGFDVMQTMYVILCRPTLQNLFGVASKLVEKLLANFYKRMNSGDDNYSIFVNFVTALRTARNRP